MFNLFIKLKLYFKNLIICHFIINLIKLVNTCQKSNLNRVDVICFKQYILKKYFILLRNEKL